MVIPFKARVGGVTINDDMSDEFALATMDVTEQMRGIVSEYYRWAEHMTDQMADALLHALTPVFELSQVLVPEDTGYLADSGYLTSRRYGARTYVEIGYGRGSNPHYAILQHENLDFFHEPPTQAKFLEMPLKAFARQVEEDIVSQIKEASGV